MQLGVVGHLSEKLLAAARSPRLRESRRASARSRATPRSPAPRNGRRRAGRARAHARRPRRRGPVVGRGSAPVMPASRRGRGRARRPGSRRLRSPAPRGRGARAGVTSSSVKSRSSPRCTSAWAARRRSPVVAAASTASVRTRSAQVEIEALDDADVRHQLDPQRIVRREERDRPRDEIRTGRRVASQERTSSRRSEQLGCPAAELARRRIDPPELRAVAERLLEVVADDLSELERPLADPTLEPVGVALVQAGANLLRHRPRTPRPGSGDAGR